MSGVGMAVALLLLMVGVPGGAGCTSSTTCGKGTFCHAARCVACVDHTGCQAGCSCSSGTCFCPADASGMDSNKVLPAGAACIMNTDCLLDQQYCYLQHCVVVPSLAGCDGSGPMVGRCRALPDAAHAATPSPTSAVTPDDDEVPRSVVIVLACLLALFVILAVVLAICLLRSKRKGSDGSQPHSPRTRQHSSRSSPHPIRTLHMVRQGPSDSPGMKCTGTMVESVEPGGPAHRAGLREGMQVLRIGKRRVHTEEDIQRGLNEPFPPGHPQTVVVAEGEGTPQPAQATHQVGDRVEVLLGENWLTGSVTEVNANHNWVTPDGWEGPCVFQQVRGLHPGSVARRDSWEGMRSSGQVPAVVKDPAPLPPPLTDAPREGEAPEDDSKPRNTRPPPVPVPRLPLQSMPSPDSSRSPTPTHSNSRGPTGLTDHKGREGRLPLPPVLSILTDSPPEFRAGDKVKALFRGEWFPATIRKIIDGRYEVDWGDGTVTKGLVASELQLQGKESSERPERSSRSFYIGERIEAVYHGEWWSGTVAYHSTAENTYGIRWEDGTFTDDVVAEDIRRLR